VSAIGLGAILLKDDSMTQWFGTRFIAGRCQAFGLSLKGAYIKPKLMHLYVMDCCNKHGYFEDSEVIVQWRSIKKTRNLAYQLRFVRLPPDRRTV
jgi:hypothetical protein